MIHPRTNRAMRRCIITPSPFTPTQNHAFSILAHPLRKQSAKMQGWSSVSPYDSRFIHNQFADVTLGWLQNGNWRTRDADGDKTRLRLPEFPMQINRWRKTIEKLVDCASIHVSMTLQVNLDVRSAGLWSMGACPRLTSPWGKRLEGPLLNIHTSHFSNWPTFLHRTSLSFSSPFYTEWSLRMSKTEDKTGPNKLLFIRNWSLSQVINRQHMFAATASENLLLFETWPARMSPDAQIIRVLP